MARTFKYRVSKKTKPSRTIRFSITKCVHNKVEKFNSLPLLFVFCLMAFLSISTDASTIVTGSGGYSSRRIQLDLSDGGYKGIVVKIDKDVPEQHCPRILSNLKVSKILNYCTDVPFFTKYFVPAAMEYI